jgi:hypothetical protein
MKKMIKSSIFKEKVKHEKKISQGNFEDYGHFSSEKEHQYYHLGYFKTRQIELKEGCCQWLAYARKLIF